jgi:ATP/maltotriose-dependent transcriptional regulator MalT
MRLSYYTDYIIIEQQILSKSIIIDGAKRRLAILKRERDRIIRQSCPSEVHAQQYDKPTIQNGYVLNEATQMEELARVTAEISDLEFAIQMHDGLRDDLQADLSKLQGIFQATEERLVNNREVKVFRLAREGKSNQEIADELGYELSTIKQTKWQINMKIAEVSFDTVDQQ